MLHIRALAILIATLVLGSGAVAQDGVLGVTIRAGEDIALPEGAILTVELLDVSRADVPSRTVSSGRYLSTDYPARVELAYDTAEIEPALSYVVAAKVTGTDDALLMRTTTAYPVLTRGADDEVEVVMDVMPAARELEETATEAATPYLAGSAWRGFEVGGRMFVGEDPPTLAFGEDGSFALYAGCNRFTGTAEIGPTSIAIPEQMAGTRMACPPERQALEDDVLAALGTVTGYTRDEDLLSLTNAAGVAVLRFQQGD